MKDRDDPRKVRSRARLLDAATELLASGRAEAVTIDAVTRRAAVARATLYRHFSSSTELVAAAFNRLIPPAPVVADTGDLRSRLVELLVGQAKIIEDVPVNVAAMCWLGLGPSLGDYSSSASDNPESRTLRSTIVERYRSAFDKVLRTPEGERLLGDHDYDLALCQLIGPLVFTKLLTLDPLGRDACERIVDDFLAARSRA
ncbi:TetR/AcrR family transcriptional regulator [Rhodococcus sp. HNM0569]|uniref:TetR/AcrR family transcriptional regulator n=1 Tax=Rhodococcus sp. HNM0569 TaxID=2716340 RepID=UPI001F0DB64D|nr:TetR/AcrR family transcriptional regulator [Rhodococcus sp. HNM0569]